MMHRQGWGEPRRFLVLALAGVLAVGFPLAAKVSAEGTGKLDSSLKLIPPNAAFYSTMLRNREQLDAFLKSKAFAKIKALPVVQMGLQELKKQLDQPKDPQLAMFLQLYNMPENQQLVELLGDMTSNEIFCYGGESFVGFTDLAMQVVGTMRYGPALAQLQGQAPGARPDQMIPLAILRALSNNLPLIKVPDLIFGFKSSKKEAADAQLKRLETLLANVEQQVPLLKGRIKREKTAGGDFMTLTLDGSLVPWQMIPFKQYEQQPGEFDELTKKLSQLKLTIALGFRGDYVMFSIGESTDALAKLGGEGSLADRPEFKPLAKFADRRITSIAYTSEAIRSKLGTSPKDIDSLVDLANLGLQKADLAAEQRDKVRKDLEELAGDIKKYIPKLGATTSFSFLTDRGAESYSYDWTEFAMLDASKPLTILNHVGGSPLLAAAGRSKPSGKGYQMLVKWIKKGNQDVEEIILPKLEPAQKEHYEKFTAIIHPLAKRLDEVTSQLFLPALNDGQAAFVLDGKIKSPQWFKMMPLSEKPLPMLEPAIVVGVSDAEKLRKAFGEYRTIVNEFIAKLHEQIPQAPDFQIPEPEVRQVKGGTLYYYPLPEQAQLDAQISPNAGLGKRVAVLAISQEHSERLLANTPLKIDGGPLGDLKKPLAGAVYFNWAATVDTAAPWIEFAATQIMARHQAEGGGDAKALEPIMAQVRVGLEVLKCLRSIASATYFEDKVLVTHTETIIKDLD